MGSKDDRRTHHRRRAARQHHTHGDTMTTERDLIQRMAEEAPAYLDY